MKIVFHKSFLKRYAKLPKKHKEQFKIRRNIFLENRSHPLLNDHELHGEYRGCRSVSITSDIRVIYYIKNNIAFFTNIGTHSELYGK